MANTTPDMTDDLHYCAKHPDREALLRCIRCDRYMCTACTVRISTGYICKECARAADDKFFHAGGNDLLIQAAVCFVGMALLAALVWSTGLASTLLFAIFLGPFAGGVVAEVALRLTGRRRDRYSDRIGTGLGLAGGALGAFIAAYGYIATLVEGDLPNRGGYTQMMQMMTDAAAALNSGVLGWAFSAVFLNFGFLVFLGLAAAAIYGRFQVRI